MTVTEYNKSVDDYADSLYRFIYKNIKNMSDAEDIIQDTFAKLWVKIDGVQAEKVKTYLFTTAYHTMIDTLRKSKFKADFSEAESIERSFTFQNFDVPEILGSALTQLSEIQRTVITLRDYEGYSYEEIGEITELSESQVKVYIYRARMQLKKYIGSIESVL